jgi:hypothetical protein
VIIEFEVFASLIPKKMEKIQIYMNFGIICLKNKQKPRETTFSIGSTC